MPVTLQLIEDGYLLHYKMTDPWTMNELLPCYRQAKQYMDASTHVIFTLVDLSAARNIPMGAMRAREDPTLTHPKSGKIVLVGANNLARSLVDVVQKVLRIQKAEFADNEIQALSLLRDLIEYEKQTGKAL